MIASQTLQHMKKDKVDLLISIPVFQRGHTLNKSLFLRETFQDGKYCAKIVSGGDNMLRSIRLILKSGLSAHAFTDTDLLQLFSGSDASRYALINKAIKSQDLIRLRRGLYVLNSELATVKFHRFYLASKMVNHSYISLESALSFHGLIPERVESTQSIALKSRSKRFDNHFGTFNYFQLPTRQYNALTQVSYHSLGEQSFLIADPVRALADTVYHKKVDDDPIEFFVESMRIEHDDLCAVSIEKIYQAKNIYRSKRVLRFLSKLIKEVKKYE